MEYVRFANPVEVQVKVVKYEESRSADNSQQVRWMGAMFGVVGALVATNMEGTVTMTHTHLAVNESGKTFSLRADKKMFNDGACYRLAITRDCYTCDVGEDFTVKEEMACTEALKNAKAPGENALSSLEQKEKTSSRPN
ncbi:MAG: hypothetical protein ACRCV9_01745 [Burkholderiaceae bacterium]